MFEKITLLDDHHMILVSRRMVLTVIGALLSLTFLLMLFFLHVDFDYLLGRKDLAMKVGRPQSHLKSSNRYRRFRAFKPKSWIMPLLHLNFSILCCMQRVVVDLVSIAAPIL